MSKIKFTEAIKAGFKNYSKFSGRASRSEFWWWVLLWGGLELLLFLLASQAFIEWMYADTYVNHQMTCDNEEELMNWLNRSEFDFYFLFISFWVIIATTIVPTVSLTYRRFHDIGKDGRWGLVLPAIFGIMSISLFVALFTVNNVMDIAMYSLISATMLFVVVAIIQSIVLSRKSQNNILIKAGESSII